MLRTFLFISGLVLIGFVTMATISTSVTTPKISASNNSSELQVFVDKIVEDNDLPSLTAASFNKEGLLHIAASGVRKYGEDVQVTQNDKYHIGSCTKAMTAVLTAMHIDDGLLDWDTRLLEVFPALQTDIHPDFHDVSVHDLLTHTSGLSSNASDPWAFQELDIMERRSKVIFTDLADSSNHIKGEFLYSNLGYMVVGSMLEKMTGKTWEALTQERIFDPLQMKSAGFGPTGPIDKIDQPWGHQKPSGFGDWGPIQFDNPESMGPAGTVHCSIEDWGKFISFQFLQNDTTLLSRTQRDKLQEVNKDNYASGWNVFERSWAKGKVFNHAGTNTMNYALVWVAPNIDRAYLVCTNSYGPTSHQISDAVVVEMLGLESE